jgi:flagellar biosynthesis chaperone FliJ
VADIRKELKDMETQVGTANFRLQQAENQLFVAQAAKAEVDKLSEIAKTYQKQQQNKKFAGC